MEDSLKTEIIIKSVTKIAQQDGIPVFVVKKGDPDSGIILIKIDLLNGKGQLIRRNYSYSLKKNKSIIDISVITPNKIRVMLGGINKAIPPAEAITPAAIHLG